MAIKGIKPSFQIEMKVFEKGELTDFLEFNGSRADAVEFINFNYSKYLLKTFFEADIKFRINKEGEFQTFENLLEKGVFII